MAFQKIKEHPLESLGALYQEFKDDITGARHIHVSHADTENAFVVAFPTLPKDDTGIAHVLEHLTLCGSQNYPVRDPFFSMLNRSVASFMNAMTYPNMTAYPFATANEKDYFNLLGVYLDATFNPLFKELDFKQEGWRYELDEAGKLAYQGVVFNEMKGAGSDASYAMEIQMASIVQPGAGGTCDYGGRPTDIPNLTNDDVKAFHQEFYHPSRAVFMTWGNIPAYQTQAQIETQILQHYQGRAPLLPLTRTLKEVPKKVQELTLKAPSQIAKDNEHGLNMRFFMGSRTDPEVRYKIKLLQAALLSESSALIVAMEGAGFGWVSERCGESESADSLGFDIGMSGLTVKQIPKAKKLILKVLGQIAEEGVPENQLKAILRDEEFAAKVIGSGSTPHGLDVLLGALPDIVSGAEGHTAIDQDQFFNWAQKELKEPSSIQKMVQELLSSQARFDFTIMPDATLMTQQEKELSDRLLAKETSLTDAERAEIKAQSDHLKKDQRAEPALHVLPTIDVAELSPNPMPEARVHFEAALGQDSGPSTAFIEEKVQGLMALSVETDLSAAPIELWPWIELYTLIMPDMGVGKMTPEKTADWRRDRCAEFDMGTSVEARLGESAGAKLWLYREVRGLEREVPGLIDALSKSVLSAQFKDLDRLEYSLQTLHEMLLDDVVEQGSDFAAFEAASHLSAEAFMEQQLGGLPSVGFVRGLWDLAENASGLKKIQKKLEEVHVLINQSPSVVLGVGEEGVTKPAIKAMKMALQSVPGLESLYGTAHVVKHEELGGHIKAWEAKRERSVDSKIDLDALVVIKATDTEPASKVLKASSPINHCHMALRGPRLDHEDSPLVKVLLNLMKAQVLHRSIREEGGAYGSSAGLSPDGIIDLGSYRDPRLEGTLHDFKSAMGRLVEGDVSLLTRPKIDSAILTTIKGLDQIHSPFTIARVALRHQKIGLPAGLLAQHRAKILNCTAEELQEVAIRYFKDAPVITRAFVGEEGAKEASRLGWTVTDINERENASDALAAESTQSPKVI